MCWIITKIMNKKHESELLLITKKYKKYIHNTKYVYTSCHEGQWLIIMMKLRDTKCNKPTNKKYVEYTANKLKVIKIINKMNPDITTSSIKYMYNLKTFVCEVGKIVVSNKFSNRFDNCDSYGLQCFDHIENAYYRDLRLRIGRCIDWLDNEYVECNFVNSLLSGGFILQWDEYRCNTTNTKYLNGLRNGKQIEYYKNKIKRREYWYSNDKKNGKCIDFHTNGNKEAKGTYLYDTPNGKWTYWYANGNKELEGEYINGKKFDQWIRWHPNGDIDYILVY